MSPVLSPSEWVLADGTYTTKREYVLSIVDDHYDEPDRETVDVVTAALTDTPDYVTLPPWVHLVILDDDTVPGRPTSLEARAAGPTAIDLRWTAPSDPGTSPLRGYQIEWSADGGTPWRFLVADTNSTATTYTDTGLSAQTTRHYRVSALSAAGIGQASEPAGARTDLGEPAKVEVTTAVVDTNGVAVTEVPEEIGTATIRVTATTVGGFAPTSDFSVSVRTKPDVAVSPADYAAVYAHVGYQVSDWVVNAEGTYGAVKDVSLAIVDDTLEEPKRETFRLLTERAADTPSYVSLPRRLQLVIVDNDAVPVEPRDGELPEVTITATEGKVTEGAEVTFTLSRTGDAVSSLTVAVEVSETGSTLRGTAPTFAVFDVGEERALLTVRTIDDSIDEADSVISVTLTAGQDAGYVVGSEASATVTVSDDDEPTGATVPGPPTDLEAHAAGDSRIDLNWTAPTEIGGAAITGYRIEWSPDGASDWSVLVEDTGSTRTTFSDRDLTAGTNRHYRVHALNSAGIGPPSNITGARTNLAPAEVTITATEGKVTEGADVTFTLSRTGDAVSSLTVAVEVSETGSTLRGTAPTFAVFDAGAARTRLAIRTVDDSVDEPDSVITVTLTAGQDAGYVVGSRSSATVTVSDDDEPPPVVTVPGPPTDLGARAAGESRIDLSWTAPAETGGAAIVGYRIEWSPDGASDWSVLVEDTGSTRTTFSDRDLTAGTNRHYRVHALNSAGIGPPSNITGARTNLAPAEVTITATEGKVTEGADVTFVLSRTGPAGEPLTVLLDVADPGLTIRGAPPASVSFAAGAGEATLVLPTVDDQMDEPDREVTVTVNAGDGYTLGSDTSATVRVKDNDAAPVFSIAGASGPESRGNLMFQVGLQGQSSMPVEVEWSTSPGTATADRDYAAVRGVLTLDPGSVGGVILISLHDDALFEENETFTVSLSRPKNAKLSGTAASATGVIENDDAAPVIRIADASASESAGAMTFRVALSGESALPATVRWASSAGTAQAGLDYVETSGELIFGPGTTSVGVEVTLIEDLLYEEPETFRLVLSGATNATLDGASEVAATGTIEDDDDTAPAEEWLARFGRTAAGNAVDALEDRLTGRLGSGSQVVVAGHRIDVSGTGQEHGAAGSAAAPVTGLGGIGQAAGGAVGLLGSRGGLLDAQPGRYGSGRMGVGDVLARSSFQFSSDSHGAGYSNRTTENGAAHGGDAGAHRWSVWGSGAATRFGGGEGDLSLDGEVVTGTVGADMERGRVLFGVAVSHSRGDEGLQPGASHRPAAGPHDLGRDGSAAGAVDRREPSSADDRGRTTVAVRVRRRADSEGGAGPSLRRRRCGDGQRPGSGRGSSLRERGAGPVRRVDGTLPAGPRGERALGMGRRRFGPVRAGRRRPRPVHRAEVDPGGRVERDHQVVGAAERGTPGLPRDAAGQHDGDGSRIRARRVGQPGKSDAVSGRGAVRAFRRGLQGRCAAQGRRVLRPGR